jgi:hypothetical protein
MRVNSSAMVGWIPTVSKRSCWGGGEGMIVEKWEGEKEGEKKREKKGGRE